MSAAAAAFAALMLGGQAEAQQVIDILSDSNSGVTGALCVGSDCTSPQNFGKDVLRLKSNIVRLHIEDSSTLAGRPSNDWRLLFNDTFDGGRDYFALQDVGTGTTPLFIEGGAKPNAIYVDDQGDVGFGTSNPQYHLHIVDGREPRLRLEQDGTEGRGPFIWDIGGDDFEFFIRSVRPVFGQFNVLEIDANADNRTLKLGDQTQVGIGINHPEATLHVTSPYSNARIFVQENSSTQASREMFRMENNGGSYFTLNNVATGNSWYFTHENAAPNRFIITSDVNPSKGLFLTDTGNLRIGGVLTENSDKTTKMGIAPVDPAAVLAKLRQLELSEWTYKVDETGARHLGPMAQEFHALFGLGADETGISSLDTSGVALAAIQALTAEVEALTAELARLKP